MKRADFKTSAAIVLLAVLGLTGCERQQVASVEAPRAPAPSILLLTLDTTRGDVLTEMPTIERLASEGTAFAQAYTTAPMTLPSHTSIFTGLYPLEHGVHENGRFLDPRVEVLAERLERLGYDTGAVISGYPLSREFGLARGFDHYDDELGVGRVERPATETTDRALAWLAGRGERPFFLWVHYFDPHDPYEPPEPFRSRYPEQPYLGEIAYLDDEIGRLLHGAGESPGGAALRIIVVGDHGESLGEHGESRHGNLLYQGVMRVPMVVAGDGIESRRIDRPVSVRRIFDTVLVWAGEERSTSLERPDDEPVLAEALNPFLQYGWQPQVMGVSGRQKVIRAGRTELYDVVADPQEANDLQGEVDLDRELASAVQQYLRDVLAAPGTDDRELTPETRERLASLGYFTSEARPELREDAPAPGEMTHLFADLDLGSGLFERGEYARAVPVFERIAAEDPGNVAAQMRLAVARSVLGDEQLALEHFARARQIAPGSIDLRHYQAMHHLRFGQLEAAAPLFESVLAQSPNRLPALAAMAQIRERQGRPDEARRYLERVVELKRSPGAELARLGELRMAATDTPGAIEAFERARAIQGVSFRHSLELGVCYLAQRQFTAAATVLDEVPRSHPGYPMALFKRAQASVLLNEPDREDRVRLAWREADATTRPLIEREPLFVGIDLR